MKDSSLKLACIFIILMYCLAPLSALDLNQDDKNNKYINQEANESDMAVEDANITISDDEGEATGHDESNSISDDEGSNAENDKDKSIDSDDEALKLGEKIESEDSKKNLSAERKQPNIRMHIDDVEEGQVPVLEVTADEKLVCLDIPAYCPQFRTILKYYEFDIHDGHGRCNLNQEKWLKPGNYTVTIDYTGTNLYYPQKASTTFEVYAKPSANPNLGINVDDINVGEKATVDITANEKINGQVYVKSDASSSETPVMVKNGHGQVTLNDTLKAGTHTASVRYDGDRIFKADEKSTTFEVKRLTPKMRVSAKDIDRYEQPRINVYTGIKKPINVTVQIYKDSNLIESSDETVFGYKSIQMDKELSESGKYTVKLIFEGNENYEACEKTTSFYVASKYEYMDPKLKIKVDDITVGEKPTVYITTDDTLCDHVIVKLNHSGYCIEQYVIVMDGHGQLTINDDDLEPGTYTANARFEGNDIFRPSNKTTKFEVKKVNPQMSVHAKDIETGESPSINLQTSFKQPTKVQLQLSKDNKIITSNEVKVTNTQTIQMHEKIMDAGTYDVNVVFEGNKTHNSAEATTSFKVDKKAPVDPNLSVKVNDVTEGEKAVAVISANNTLSGKVELKLNSSDAVYPVHVFSGSATFTIDEDLAPGDYLATVSFAGDDTFTKAENSSTFKVNKKAPVDPNLSIKVDDIYEDEKAVAVISANNTLNGEARVYLNNSNAVYPVSIVDGSGSVTIDDDLAPGEYLATVSFAGDDSFKKAENSTTFKVIDKEEKKADLKLSIKVNDITEGDKAVALVSANKSLNSKVKIKLNGSSTVYNAQLIRGKGKYIIDKDLAPGEYIATVSYAGDKTFKKAENTTTFKVNKKPELPDPNLSIKVNDIYDDEKAVAIVSANNTLNGEARVYLNNSNAVYPVSIVDGSGSVTIDDDLAPGDYLATVSFAGDDSFKKAENSTTFKVIDKEEKKADLKLSIRVNDITEGEKAVALVVANRSLSGKVKIKLNGSSTVYNAHVLGGRCKYIIDEDLAPGDYLATVSYDGDNTFKKAESSTTFKVNEKVVPELVDPNLSIKVNDITEGDKAVALVSANETLSGEARVYLNNSNAVYPVSIVDGSGSVTIDEDLAPGDYLATVSFAGDDTFKKAENSTTFKVNEKVVPELVDPNLSIKVNDITEGDKAVAVISANNTLNGEVKVKLNGSSTVYNVKVVNGNAKLTIDEDLAPGGYIATVSFDGDDTFKKAEKSTTFKVNEKVPELVDPNLKISAKNIYYGQKATITVTTNAKFTGNVNVNLANKNYNVKVTNGKGSFSVSGLKVGKYTAKATFKQTAEFKASTKSTNFVVKKANVPLSAKVKTFKFSQKTKKYSVSLKDNQGKALKGKKLTLKVNGKTYTAKTNAKGVATFKITKLNKIGVSKAVIAYAGDKSFNKVSKKVKITVKFDAISVGSKDKAMVKKIQRDLKKNSFYISYKGHYLRIDGKYLIHTKRAVKQYQASKGLKASGKVDKKTAKKLKLI